MQAGDDLIDALTAEVAGLEIENAGALVLLEAERRWHDLLTGGMLSRPWPRHGDARAARAIPPRGRRSGCAPRPAQRNPRRA